MLCQRYIGQPSALSWLPWNDLLVSCMQAKQTAMEEMTQGQAATLVRNEQIIDQAAEEMDDLEEMLNESISDSMRSTKEKAAGQGKQQKKRCWSARNLFSHVSHLEGTALQSKSAA